MSTEYATLRLEIKEDTRVMSITMDRPESKNAINLQLLQEINDVLDLAEKNPEIRTVILRGNEKFFCTGMDFKEAENEKAFPTEYSRTLKRFATISKIVVSICEGKVIAGGVGFAAASDIVIASPAAVFTLSELMWGLLPANVLPYLIRRTGFQSAYFMTLSTLKNSAQEAKDIHLVDILSEDPDSEFLKLNERLSLIDPQTISRMKSYFRKMWLINEEMEQLAIKTLSELKQDPIVQKNIKNYVENGKLPWEYV